MGGRSGLLLLLEPVLLGERSAVLAGSRTLDIDRLRLVCVQLARNVGLLGGGRGLGDGECLDVALGIVGLDLRDLVGLELAEVQVLHQIGCTNWVSTIGGRAIGMNHLSERPWE